MAYDADLAPRIDDLTMEKPRNTGKKEFGGVGYLLKENVSVDVHKHRLIFRRNPKQIQELLERSHARPFEIIGWPANGWLLMYSKEAAKDLNTWFEIALAS